MQPVTLSRIVTFVGTVCVLIGLVVIAQDQAVFHNGALLIGGGLLLRIEGAIRQSRSSGGS